MTEHAETLEELAQRYLAEKVAAGAGGFPQFEMKELNRIREFVEARFGEDDRVFLYLYTCIEREFARGHRCGVCGRTTEQSAAINYDCAREC